MQARKLERENRWLSENNAALERQLAATKGPVGADEVWRLREENRQGRFCMAFQERLEKLFISLHANVQDAERGERPAVQ